MITKEIGHPMFGPVDTVKVKDTSFYDYIFMLIGKDDMIYVCDIVHSGRGYPTTHYRRTIQREDFNAYPVGPQVIASLKLREKAKELQHGRRKETSNVDEADGMEAALRQALGIPDHIQLIRLDKPDDRDDRFSDGGHDGRG
jgi:hypothetical protein